MVKAEWFCGIFRSFFMMIDKMVYRLIITLYNLFSYISKMTVFATKDFDAIMGRVYLVLGIVMLFKVAFSLIGLFANPDDLMDSKKGITGIVQRIIISLVLITFVPTIFQTAYRIQSFIIRDNIIGNFILGSIISKEDTYEKVNDFQTKAGQKISFQILSAFYYVEPSVEKNTIPLVDYQDGIEKEMIRIDNDGGFGDRNHCDPDNPTLCGAQYFHDIIHYTNSIEGYAQFVNEQTSMTGGQGDGYYAMHYDFILSTIAGVVVAWMFFGFCFDAAIRTVKLGVLQLIAPIPIFSYIDPKKGENIFNNWIKTYVSTYLSLFGRLVIIYFVIFICYLLAQHDIMMYNESGIPTPIQADSKDSMYRVAVIFIYFGLFKFAMEAPKLFGEMFGIKTEPSFGTKIAKAGMIGTGLAAAGIGGKMLGESYKWGQRTIKKGALQRTIDSDIATTEQKEKAQKDLEKLRSQRTGFGRAAWSGASQGMLIGLKSDGKWSSKFMGQTMTQANAIHKRRDKNSEYRRTFSQDLSDKIAAFAGVQGDFGAAEADKTRMNQLKNYIKDANTAEAEAQRVFNKEFHQIMSKYKVDSNLGIKFEEAIRDPEKDAIKEMENLIKAAGVDASTASNMEKDFNYLIKQYDYVKFHNERGIKFEKTLGKLKDRQTKKE